jgi:hypothetical protein
MPCNHAKIFSGKPTFQDPPKPPKFEWICRLCHEAGYQDQIVSGHADPDLDDYVSQDLFAKLAPFARHPAGKLMRMLKYEIVGDAPIRRVLTLPKGSTIKSVEVVGLHVYAYAIVPDAQDGIEEHTLHLIGTGYALEDLSALRFIGTIQGTQVIHVFEESP